MFSDSKNWRFLNYKFILTDKFSNYSHFKTFKLSFCLKA